MVDKEVVKCPSCGNRFPVNYWKHPNRKVINCPFCGVELKQGFFDKKWKPNELWHIGKHKSETFTVAKMRQAFNKLIGRRH